VHVTVSPFDINIVYIDDHGSGTVNDGDNGTEASSTQPGMLC
jgi:hypothetical protein